MSVSFLHPMRRSWRKRSEAVIILTDEERQAFRDAAQPVYDKYVPEIGEDLVKQIDEINAKYVK